MIVNQANLHGLAVGCSTAYNKSFEATQSIIRRSYHGSRHHSRAGL